MSFRPLAMVSPSVVGVLNVGVAVASVLVAGGHGFIGSDPLSVVIRFDLNGGDFPLAVVR